MSGVDEPGKAEILAPAGSPQALIAAVRCGANAVYLGGRELNARRNAANFSREELAQAVEYCHARAVKVYLTLNTLVRDDELKTALGEIERACEIKADALILQDIGLARLAAQAAPGMPLHASTQCSVQTADGLKLLRDLGFCRAVLPRELSKKEIELLARDSPLELEMFVHGALCMSLSGQCLFSAVLGSRSGNRGLCAQPCRLPFFVQDGTGHDLSLKDLSLIGRLGELAQMGIASFKIEGRMKRPEYVAAAVTACKKSLAGENIDDESRRLGAVFSRSGFTDGYYTGLTGRDMFGTRRKEDVVAAKEELAPLAALYDGEVGLIRADMRFSARLGKLPVLSVSALGRTVSVSAALPVEAARGRAVTEEELASRLSKCGSTQFFAGDIQIISDDGIYMSAAQINALRRLALDELAKKTAQRPQISFVPPPLKISKRRGENRGFVLRVASCAQLPENLRGVRRVILPADADAAHAARLRQLKIQAALEVPAAVWGGGDELLLTLQRAKQNGFSLAAVCGLDAAATARRAGLKICALPATNIFNTPALEAFKALGASDAVVSVELKISECAALGSSLPRGVFAYGRLPLMQMRNCPLKNGCGCAECKKSGFITDRKGIRFPLECGPFASTLLNSVPLSLSDKQDQLSFADFSLLWFTTESKQECERVLESFRQGDAPQGEFTRGLAFRGVE